MPASKFSIEVQERLCRALLRGIDVSTACAVEGISRRSFYGWRERGERGEEPYAEFLVQVDKAMARVETAVTATVVRAAMRGDWRAATEWLRLRKIGGRACVVQLRGVEERPLALSPKVVDEIRRAVLGGVAAE